MPKYFMQGTRLESFEKMMMAVPRHRDDEDEDEEPRSRKWRRDHRSEEGEDDPQSGTE